MASSEPMPASGEILYGVKAIAAFLGVRDRQALHLVETDRIPFFRVGKIVCARRAALRTWISQQEAKTSGGDA